jgi:hypothetical protein
LNWQICHRLDVRDVADFFLSFFPPILKYVGNRLQKLVGTKAQRRAIGDAVTGKAVAKISGAGKYNTKKFASDAHNIQSLVGTKAQRRAVGDAITDKALAKIAGSGVMLAGRGHKKTCLEKAMCS